MKVVHLRLYTYWTHVLYVWLIQSLFAGGERITWFGQTIGQDGDYTHFVYSNGQCDTAFTLNVLVWPGTFELACSNDNEKFMAFLAFHATGHNAGINHVVDSYMEAGPCIPYYLGHFNSCYPLATSPNLNSLEELVDISFDNPIGAHVLYREKLKNRFGN